MCAPSGAYPITVEYFQFSDDELYSNPDDEALLEYAQAELQQMGLVEPDQVLAGFVVRSRIAYPVLELGHAAHLDRLREYLRSFDNVQPIGRGGMFKYNNQDHSIATGLLAARNILGAQHDVWAVNIDAEYHEAGDAEPAVPGAPNSRLDGLQR
jgi:protoporphyrinogen oxidase